MKNKEKIFMGIISDFQDMIFRLCCSYINNADGRKDLYQNILIRIWRGLDTFEGRSAMSTWIYRISVNTGLDFLRTESKNKRILKNVDIDDIEVIDKTNNLEEDFIISENTALMYNCINKLSFIDKTIITLYLESLSYQEIAEIVGISEKNVSVKLHRIKKTLNECLKDF